MTAPVLLLHLLVMLLLMLFDRMEMMIALLMRESRVRQTYVEHFTSIIVSPGHLYYSVYALIVGRNCSRRNELLS